MNSWKSPGFFQDNTNTLHISFKFLWLQINFIKSSFNMHQAIRKTPVYWHKCVRTLTRHCQPQRNDYVSQHCLLLIHNVLDLLTAFDYDKWVFILIPKASVISIRMNRVMTPPHTGCLRETLQYKPFQRWYCTL